MNITERIYYLEINNKFPRIYNCDIIIFTEDELKFETKAKICKHYKGEIIKKQFADKIFFVTQLDAIIERKKRLGELLYKETIKFNRFVQKVNKWKEKKK